VRDLIPLERISGKIYKIRKNYIMLDQDLAELYGIETRHLIQAVKRNINRFPEDFMFQLFKDEFKILRSQIVTSSWGGRRYPPYAFTEQGVAMLSSVINSSRAVNVNIAIMRAFVQLRKMSYNYSDLLKKIESMEKKYDKQFRVVFEAIKQLIETPTKKLKGKIGFHKD
jgi:phage regulator Rha-like protein